MPLTQFVLLLLLISVNISLIIIFVPSSRMDFQMLALLMVVLACVEQSLASCVVESFTVKDDFDPKRVSPDNPDGPIPYCIISDVMFIPLVLLLKDLHNVFTSYLLVL